MEARLFFLAIWCGFYGQIIRLTRRSDAIARGRWTAVVLNGLFWGTFAVMAGMLIASYTEKMDLSLQYALIFGAAGAAVGAIVGYWKGGSDHTREPLIQDNLEWADTGFSAILLASIVMFFFVQAFKIPSGSMRMTFIEGDHLFVNKYVYGFPIPFTDKKIGGNTSLSVPVPLTGRRLTIVSPIETNDIVIFRFPAENKTDQHYGKDFIKRTIALAGQEVKIVDKQLFVDGVARDETFKRHVDGFSFPPVSMNRDQYQRAWESGDFARLGTNEVRDNFGPVVVPPDHIFVMGDNRDRSFDSRFWGPLKQSAVKGKAWLLYFPLKRIRLVR